jgi:putative hydrolase
MTSRLHDWSDWHTHSDLTDGTASPDAMADAAVEAGLSSWGLSDHVRADTTWLPEYVATIRSIRREDLQIRCGVEAKLLDTAGHLDLPTELPRLDYVLIADHQFPGRDGPLHPAAVKTAIANGSMTVAGVVSELVAATIAGVRRSPYLPIIAHLFSLLPKMGLSEADVSDAHLRSLASACLHAGGVVEANEKWQCPSARTVAYLAGKGVPIIAGSDAHRVEDVGRRDYFDIVMARVDLASEGDRSTHRSDLIDHPV